MLDIRTGKHFNGSDNGSFNGSLTRRETIKGGLGLAAILAAGKAPALLLGAKGVAFGKEPLPYDAEVEYLSFDGNQYVDPSYNIESGVRYISAVAKIDGVKNDWGTIFGSFDGFRPSIALNATQIFAGTYKNGGNTYYMPNKSIPYNLTNFIYDLVDGKIHFKDVSTGLDWGSSNVDNYNGSSYNCTIFGYLPTEEKGLLIGKLYSFKIVNQNSALDLVAVRKNGLGYFFDKESNRLLGNSKDNGRGFDAHLIGPDKT